MPDNSSARQCDAKCSVDAGNALDVVTGAFGYTGKYIARMLSAAGRRVRTLTGRRDAAAEDLPGAPLEVFPFCFDNPSQLVEHLRGAHCLYNTYWVRFSRGRTSFEQAIANSQTLIDAARQAGVSRLVHISITNPSEQLRLPYFAGKARVERAVRESGLSYAIIRPTVVFGREDILINNIAWLLRRLPIFAIPGNGDYRVQPVYVEDVAALAVQAGARPDNVILDAAGPEVYTFDQLVREIARHVGSRTRVVHSPTWLSLLAAKLIGLVMRDVVLTRQELQGLMGDLLVSKGPATGSTSFHAWLAEHAECIGCRFASELERHFRRD